MTSKFEPGHNRRAAPDHLLIAPGRHATALNEIDRALLTLAPTGSRALLVALFEHRTTAGTIRQWRYGRRSTPRWAREIMIRKLLANAAALEHVRAMILAERDGPGLGHNRKEKPSSL